jgi:hypothetical protein
MVAAVTQRELAELRKIPRHCWFSTPRHYSASLGSDAATFGLSAT